jgi:hypothetical protein
LDVHLIDCTIRAPHPHGALDMPTTTVVASSFFVTILRKKINFGTIAKFEV